LPAQNNLPERDAARVIVILAGIAVVLVALRYAEEIVVPFLLAVFIAIIAAGPVRSLRKRGLPTWGAVSITILALAGIQVAVALMLGTSFAEFEAALPEYQAQLVALEAKAIAWFGRQGIDLADSGLFTAVNPGVAMDFANRFVVGIGDGLSDALLILFLVVFLLIEAAVLPRKISAMAPDRSDALLQRLVTLMDSTNRYVGVKAVVSLVTGLLIWIALWIIGLEYAILWGFVAFLLNFIPTIGSILAAVPAAILALLTLDPILLGAVISVYVVVNLLVGNVLEPAIMGQQVGLSTLTVFVSLVFWGWMFGPVGMLLSVPLSMVVRSIAETSSGTQWIAILMAPAPPATENKT
jgi:AI-2 transport protein TqsA